MDPSAASIVGGLPLFGICLSGVKARVVLLRKRSSPAVGEIKDRHVEEEPRVVSGCAPLKCRGLMVSEVVLTLFCFHVICYRYNRNGTVDDHHIAVAGIC